MSADLRPLTTADVDWASQLLGRAFDNDPFTRYLFPDPTRRRRELHYFYRPLLQVGLRHGEVYTDAQQRGVVCWLPGDLHLSVPEYLRDQPYLLPLHLRLRFLGLLRAHAQFEALHARLAPPQHTYLSLLGVEPAAQGQGVATTLLRPKLRQLDELGVPCYLETQNGHNVRLYQHFGFELREAQSVAGSEAIVYAMLRPACPHTT